MQLRWRLVRHDSIFSNSWRVLTHEHNHPRLHGSAEVEFLREGVVVHRERFSQKYLIGYRQPIRTTESFDGHRCRFVTSARDMQFKYEVVA
jgi:hypothetical protein